MQKFNYKHLLLSLIAFITLSGTAMAQPVSNSVVGVQGYDLVSYHTGKRPQRGNGNYVVEHEGVSYLFVSEENKIAFAKNPQKYS